MQDLSKPSRAPRRRRRKHRTRRTAPNVSEKAAIPSPHRSRRSGRSFKGSTIFFGHDSRIEKVLSLPVSDLGKAVEAVIQYAGEIDRSNPDNWEVLMPQEQNLREALAAALGKTL